MPDSFEYFTYIISFAPDKTLLRIYYDSVHFTREEVEVQSVSCPRSHAGGD